MKNKYKDAPEASTTNLTVTRRDFLKASGFVIAGLSVGAPFAYAAETDSKVKVRFGIVTDAHYTDAAPHGSRYYNCYRH